MPSLPSSSSNGPLSISDSGAVTVFITPDRNRATYQGSRSTPWD